jgi:thiol-disulfide isomerase/thioredoxin
LSGFAAMMNLWVRRSGVSVRVAAGVVAAALVVVVAIAFTPERTAPAVPPRVGWMANFTPSPGSAPAPQARFVDRDGVARTLADFRGKVVLVNFWATWCSPCVREMPSLLRLQNQLGGDKFTVLALSQDRGGWSVMAPFVTRLGLERLPTYHDPRGDLAAMLGVRGLPTTALFDAQGRELGRLVGVAEWDSPEAVRLVRHYLGQ